MGKITDALKGLWNKITGADTKKKQTNNSSSSSSKSTATASSSKQTSTTKPTTKTTTTKTSTPQTPAQKQQAQKAAEAAQQAGKKKTEQVKAQQKSTSTSTSKSTSTSTAKSTASAGSTTKTTTQTQYSPFKDLPVIGGGSTASTQLPVVAPTNSLTSMLEEVYSNPTSTSQPLYALKNPYANISTKPRPGTPEYYMSVLDPTGQWKTQLEKDLANKPYSNSNIHETYDVNESGNNVNANTKYNVKTVTTTNYKQVHDGINDGQYQVWIIVDGDEIGQQKLYNYTDSEGHTQTGVCHTIGRDRLAGSMATDECVIYDPNSKEFFRYAHSEKMDELTAKQQEQLAEMEQAKQDAARTASRFEADVGSLEWELQKYVDKTQNGGKLTNKEYEEFQKLYEQYEDAVARVNNIYEGGANNYQKILEQYQTTTKEKKNTGLSTGTEVETYWYLKQFVDAADRVAQGKGDAIDRQLLTSQFKSLVIPEEVMKQYEELAAKMEHGGYVYADGDYITALNDYAQGIRDGIDAYNTEVKGQYADFNSSTQCNSFIDVLHRMVGRFNGQFQDTDPWEDTKEAWSYKVSAFQNAKNAENATAWSIGVATLSATLVDLGETLDITNVIKPFYAGMWEYSDGNYENPAHAAWLRQQTQKEWEAAPGWAKQFWTSPGGDQPGSATAIESFAGWVAFKDIWGWYGETPNYDILNSWEPEDRNAFAYATSIGMDIVLDPATWFDVFGKVAKASKASSAVADNAAELLAKQYDNWAEAGACIIRKVDSLSDETLEQIVKNNAERGIVTIVKSDETDSMILKAYENAVKHAYDLGGDSAQMVEALTQASLKNTENVFNAGTFRALRDAIDPLTDRAGLTSTYLKSLDDLELTARTAYRNAIVEFTKNSTATTIATFKNVAQEEGATFAKLIYDTPKMIGTLHTLDEVQSIINKSLMAVSAPVLSIPVASARALKFLVGTITDVNLAKTAAEALSSLGKHIADAASAHKAFSKTLSSSIDDITKEFSVLYANSGMTQEAALFYKQFEESTLEAYADHILGDTMDPLCTIMRDLDNTNGATILKRLDDWAVAQGFVNFKEANAAIMKNVGLLTQLSPQSASVYSNYQRLYRNVVAAKNIEGAAQTVRAYNATVKDITKQLADLDNGADTILCLTNMHSATQTLRNGFNGAIPNLSITAKQYEDAANTLIDSIKNYGDTGTVASRVALNKHLDEFTQLTETYAKEVDDYRNTLLYVNYQHTPQSEYVSLLSDKTSRLPQQREAFSRVAEGIRKELQNHHGVNVSAEEIQDALLYKEYKEFVFNADGSLNTEALQRVYQVQLDKYTGALQYTDDPGMRKIVDDVLDINTETNCALRNLQADIEARLQEVISQVDYDTAVEDVLRKQLDDIQTFFNTCAEQRATRFFFDRFETEALINQCDNREINAVLDAFAGDNSHRINANARAWMETHNANCVENIVDAITDSSTEYLRQVSDKPIDYLWHYGCNTADTSVNVERIAELAKTRAADLADDTYIDVYYSCAGTVRGADPHMLSFKVGDTTQTFRNADSPFRLKESHAQKMYGKTYSEVMQDYADACAKIPGSSQADYIANIQTYLLDLNHRAAAEGKQLRFIGFNAGAATSEMDKFIKDFLVNNGVAVRWNSTVDIGELIRRAEDYATLSDGTIKAIRKTVCETLDSAKVDFMRHHVTGAIVMDTNPNLAGMAQNIRTTMKNYDPDTQRVIASLLEGVDHTAHTIDEFRVQLIGTDLGALISEREIADYLEAAQMGIHKSTRINNMRALYGAIADYKEFSSGSLQVKKIFDQNLMNEWFTEDALSRIITNDMTSAAVQRRMNAAYDMSKGMSRHFEQVANPELIEAIGTDAYKEVWETMLTVLNADPKLAGTDAMCLLSEMRLTNAQEYYAAMSYMQAHFGQHMNLDVISTQLTNLNKLGKLSSKNWNDALITLYPETAADLIYNSAHTVRRYNTHSLLIETKYASMEEQVVRTKAMMDACGASIKDAESLGSYLDLKEAVYRQNRLLTADERINYELFKEVYDPYLKLVEDINAASPIKYTVDGVPTLQQAQMIADYNKEFAQKLRTITNFNETRKTAAVTTALMLDDEQFAQYVMRYCMNALVIDPHAKMFQGTAGVLLGKKLDSLINNPALGLKVERFVAGTGAESRECIRIYKDLSALTPKELDELINSLDHVDLDLFNKYKGAWYTTFFPGARNAEDMAAQLEKMDDFQAHLFRSYNKYNDEMVNYMPEHYFVSSMDVMSQDTMKALQEVFPETSRFNVGRINNWFDESYGCSIWGDIDFQRMYNPYASDKLVENMGRGLHQVSSKMEATTNLVRMFDNPTQSLRYMVEAAGAQNASWKTISKQLDDRGYVLATIKRSKDGSYTAIKKQLTSEKALKTYLKDDSVICIEGSVFNKINEQFQTGRRTALYNTMHGNVVTSAMADMYLDWVRTVRSARITSTLFLSNMWGTGLRNVLDSTIKGFNDSGFTFLSHIKNAIEYQDSYTEVYAKILEEFKHVDSDTIAKFYNKYGAAELPQHLFEELHVLNELSSTGMTTLLDINKTNVISKMRSILPDATKYTDDELKSVAEIFNKEHAVRKFANIPGALKDTVQSQMYADVLKKLEKTYSAADAKELADLFYKYTPTAQTWGQALQNIPGLGWLVNADAKPLFGILPSNAKVFSDAEKRTRTALYLTYVEDFGATAARAEQAIIKTQFDYSNPGLFLGGLEKLLPFTTFKIYNAAYWLEEATKNTVKLKLATKYAYATNPPMSKWEIAQMIRNEHIAQAMKDKDTDVGETDGSEGVMGWFANNILGYKGVPETYAQGLRLGDNHYLKVGNTFTEAIKLCSDLFYAPAQIAKGQLPSILADSAYSPLGTVFKYLADLNKYDWLHPTDETWMTHNPEAGAEQMLWVEQNYYDMFNLVPVLGMFTNMVSTHIKNGAVNLPDFIMMMCDPNLQYTFVQRAFQGMCDVAGTVLPSFVGVMRDTNKYGGALNYYERPVGLNWSENTALDKVMQRINPATGKKYTEAEAQAYIAEYRGTHMYVAGVSSLPSFMCKDPSTYINYSAMFIKMGFSEEDVKAHLGELLSQLYGGGFINDPNTNGIYINRAFDGKVYLDINLVNDTLAALAAQGYTIDEAIEMMKKQQWYDPKTGQFYTYTQADKAVNNTLFLKYYQMLPEYMRYDKEQYSALMQYWKAQGLTTEQAWVMMQHEHGYIDEQGRYRILTDEQMQLYTQQLNDDFYEFTAALPDWYKYEPGAASRAMNYFIQQGMTREQAQQYIIEHNAYVDTDGKVHYFTAEEAAAKTKANSKEFQEYYSTLPDYIKYEKGAYSRTLAYLKGIPGMSEEEAKRMIQSGAYLTVDGRLINCSDLQRNTGYSGAKMTDEEWNNYYNSLPDYTKYEKGAFKRTYSALKKQGYTHDAILEMIRNGFYIDKDGNAITDVRGMQHPVLGYATFNDYYQSLPNYIKYEKGAYKRTYAALKNLGFDYEQSLSLIKQGAYLMEAGTVASIFNTLGAKREDINVTDIHTLLQKYGGTIIHQDGKDWMLIDCSGLNRSRSQRGGYNTTGDRYTKYHYTRRNYTRRGKGGGKKSSYNPKKFMRPKNTRAIKHYVKPFNQKKPYVTKGSYSSTYSKVNFLAGASYGARKAFKVTLGYNPVRQSLSIKSTYPASYRNIVYSTRHNMYKDQYAKYGASRMMMRSNVSHMYSNASVIRLRRNEIQNRIQYANRRSNF